MSITHIVLFQFKASASRDEIRKIVNQLLELKDKCVRAGTSTPYIRSITGGKDNSLEGRQDGITHAFIVEFDSASDREYYVAKDKNHHAFVNAHVKTDGSLIEKAIVVDFQPGEY